MNKASGDGDSPLAADAGEHQIVTGDDGEHGGGAVMSEDRGFGALRHELALHGIVFETESVHRGDVAGVVEELELPDSFVDLYLPNDPVPDSSVPWVVEELSIFSLRRLSAAQEGYRWTGQERRVLDGWPATWVCVASVFGDSFVVDLGDPGLSVHFTRHGAGAWDARRVAPGMAEYLHALSLFESVLVGEFDRDVWSDEGLRPDFVRRLQEVLGEVLPSADLVTFLAGLD